MNRLSTLPERFDPVYIIDSYANGISVGKVPMSEVMTTSYALHLEEESAQPRLRSRYALTKESPLLTLSKQLEMLSRKGLLSVSSIIFGQATDPFLPFDNKFTASMKLLEQFKRFRPQLLVIQTRSPLVVIAMPVIRELGKHIQITVPIETPDQAVLDKYLPGLPTIEDRIRLIRTLRKFGVHVRIQAGPLLPYGDWKQGALPFAKMLCDLGDSVVLSSVIDIGGDSRSNPEARAVARNIATDRKFHWLRPDTTKPLEEAICAVAPEKFERRLPIGEAKEVQIPLFGKS